MSIENENYEWLKALAFDQGAKLFGVAEIEPLKKYFLLSPAELAGLKFGVSIGVVLSRAVLDGIKDRPTLLYKWHYRQANNLLDKIAFILTEEIIERGYKALPVPASQIVDWEKQRGHISHRMLGEAAGLGWRGKNNLLVNEEYGSQFRLVSVLTNLPLKVDKPVEFGCGDCTKCIDACPVGALGQTPADYDFDKCFGLLTTFSKQRGIGAHICGICVKVCPGRKKG